MKAEKYFVAINENSSWIQIYFQRSKMNGLEHAVSPQGLVSDLDRLIMELSNVRRRVAALVDAPPSMQTTRSAKDAEWFGMWADREDLRELSSREWLTQLRTQQWSSQ